MKLALNEAKIALDKGNWPIGCVIELDGKIISKAHNMVHNLSSRIDHAELIAIKKVSKMLWDNPKQATLYSSYEPCPMCFSAIMLSGIKKIVFGSNVDRSGASNIRNFLPSIYQDKYYEVDVIGDVLEKECSEIFLKGNMVFLPEKNKLYDVLEKNNIDIEVLRENNVFLLGGSILRLFMDLPLDSDLDFYVETKANCYNVITYFDDNFVFECDFGNTRSYSSNENELQILNEPELIDEFIKTFDFTIIKSYFSFKEDKFVFHDRFFDDIKNKKLVYESDTNRGAIGSLKRVDKFKKLGFEIDTESFKKLYNDAKVAGKFDETRGLFKKKSWLRDKELTPVRPGIDIFVNWLMDIKDHPILEKFNVYLWGGFISRPHETKDIDILITKRNGQRATLKELEVLMVDMFNLAYDIHGFFLDTCYMRIPQWIGDYPRNKEILKSVERKQLFITISKYEDEGMVCEYRRYGILNCSYTGSFTIRGVEPSSLVERWVDLDANYARMVDLRKIIKYYENNNKRNIEDFLNKFQEYSGY